MISLSHYQAEQLLAAKTQGLSEVSVSLDLNMSTVIVGVDEEGVVLAEGGKLEWPLVEKISQAESRCFQWLNGEARAVQLYSEHTGRVYSLYPTAKAPTMLISGIPMHRIKDTDPHADTLEKIRAIHPIVGEVLDTATGLGYTAIEASRTAEHVTTIELDPVALDVCRSNPWSQELFDNPKITQVIGDSFEVVSEMDGGRFSRIIHDPPVFALAGELYSAAFYNELYRVLRNKGRLFHYIGDPESKSGRSMTAGVIRRLEQAGFRQVRRAARAFGVVAVK